jgi:glycosyltransferase involved in cell wall biosynthesis
MSRPAGPSRVHITPFWPANPYQPLLVDGLRHLGLDVETGTLLKSLRRGPAGRPGAPELLHLHWLPVAGPGPRRLARWWLFARRLARLRQRGVPVVWTAHNVVPHESTLGALDLWMSRTVALHAHRIICHSAGARADLISHLQIADDAKVRVIPHGHYIESYPNGLSRTACRTTLCLPADVTVFLLLGAIRPYKGVLELIDAFRRMTEPDVRLLIAGKPHDTTIDTDVRARTAQDARVSYYPGRVSDEDLQVYLNAADTVVLPYQKSLSSGALVLAMSFGRACIAPRLPGLADCLGDRGGILYAADGRDALFEALSTAVAQRQRLPEMGAANLEQARSWDWTSIAAATAECYGEAVDVAGRANNSLARM